MKNIRILTIGIGWILSVVISINILAMQPDNKEILQKSQATSAPTNDTNDLTNIVVGKKRSRDQALINQDLNKNNPNNDDTQAAKKVCTHSIFEENSSYLENCQAFLTTFSECYQNEENITFEEFNNKIEKILTNLEKLAPSKSKNQKNNITTGMVDYQKNKKQFDTIANFIKIKKIILLMEKFRPMSFTNWITAVENLITNAINEKRLTDAKKKTKSSNRWYWGTVIPLASVLMMGLYNSIS